MNRFRLVRAVVLAYLICPRSADAAPPYAASQPTTDITLSTARLNGMTTPNGSGSLAWFEWGATTAYGQLRGPVAVGTGSGVVRVSAELGNLLAHQIYHSRLVISNATGMTFGANQHFVTFDPHLAPSGAEKSSRRMPVDLGTMDFGRRCPATV